MPFPLRWRSLERCHNNPLITLPGSGWMMPKLGNENTAVANIPPSPICLTYALVKSLVMRRWKSEIRAVLAIEWSHLHRTRQRRCSEDCHYFWLARTTPEKSPFPLGDLHPHLIRGFLDPPESSFKKAYGSVQPFLHNSPQSVPLFYNGPLGFHPKITSSLSGIGPLSNTWYL